MDNVVQQLLRSSWVWTLTGLTYPTAVYATNGRILTVSEYLKFCQAQMTPLFSFFQNRGTIVEFGTGLGGNLLAVSDTATRAIGIDINPLYLRQARRIAAGVGRSNVAFIGYDGKTFPDLGCEVDTAFSVGVFERIPRERVAEYLRSLTSLLKPGGWLLAYFLIPAAATTTFVRRLGAGAYVYWTPSESQELLESCGVEIRSRIPWGRYPSILGSGDQPVAEMLVGLKR